MRKIGIYGQYLHDESIKTVHAIIEALLDKSCTVQLESDFATLMESETFSQEITLFEQLDKSFDMLISIGGDGTILRAVAYIGKLDIPILESTRVDWDF